MSGAASQKQAIDTRSPENIARYIRAREILARYNQPALMRPEERAEILAELLGTSGQGAWVEAPFYCDYGDNVSLGAGVFLNFNCVLLDGGKI